MNPTLFSCCRKNWKKPSKAVTWARDRRPHRFVGALEASARELQASIQSSNFEHTETDLHRPALPIYISRKQENIHRRVAGAKPKKQYQAKPLFSLHCRSTSLSVIYRCRNVLKSPWKCLICDIQLLHSTTRWDRHMDGINIKKMKLFYSCLCLKFPTSPPLQTTPPCFWIPPPKKKEKIYIKNI